MIHNERLTLRNLSTKLAFIVRLFIVIFKHNQNVSSYIMNLNQCVLDMSKRSHSSYNELIFTVYAIAGIQYNFSATWHDNC